MTDKEYLKLMLSYPENLRGHYEGGICIQESTATRLLDCIEKLEEMQELMREMKRQLREELRDND